jgi:binding-protein-dependent transport system inner membrane component
MSGRLPLDRVDQVAIDPPAGVHPGPPPRSASWWRSRSWFLAITIDTVGFCGRFFADAIEDVEDEYLEGLRVTGASEPAIVAGAVLPSAAPSLLATSAVALELAVRSSVVLGLVGTGGIGTELDAAMQLRGSDEIGIDQDKPSGRDEAGTSCEPPRRHALPSARAG